jgi:Flp pilus assembly protein TadD
VISHPAIRGAMICSAMICPVNAMPSGSRLLACSALLLSLVIPKSLHAQANVAGKIIGNVRVSRSDFPDHPVLISLETRGSVMSSAYTDSQGRFGFYALPANPYKITVHDDAYEAFSVDVDVNPSNSPMNFVQVTLIPRTDVKKDPLPGRVAGSNPVLVDPADYNRQFPKKTLKEFEKGVEADHKGNADDAVQHYLKALSYSPDFYPAHNNLGALYVGKSDFKPAEEQFREAIRLDQSDAQAYFNLGHVLMLTNRLPEAETTLAAGLQRGPDSAFGYLLQGHLYAQTGKLAEAESSLQNAIRLDSKMPDAYLQLVSLYLRQNRRQDAITELQAFLKGFPDAAAAPKAKTILTKLQIEEGAVKR